MKKHYLRISIAAFFIAALTFSTSCSKKSSEDPKPATTTTPPVATSTKPAAPNTSNKSTANQTEDGTLRVPTTATPVGSVTVLDQNQQRSQMTSDNTTKLDNLTGKGTTQGRMEAGTTDFGWFISDVTVNGKAYSDQEMIKNGFDAVFFFNIDESGYYWQYHISEDSWAWGTYGIDANMTTIAFDFNDNLVPNEVWQITKLTDDRLVVKGKFNMVEQYEGDTTREIVVIGLNGYDLTNNEYNGQTDVDPEEKVFVGNWQQYEEPSIDFPVEWYLNIYEDGTYKTTDYTVSFVEEDNGSWIMEEVPGEDSLGNPTSTTFLYPTYYDVETESVITDKYKVEIKNGFMEMHYYIADQPTGSVVYFKRTQ